MQEEAAPAAETTETEAAAETKEAEPKKSPKFSFKTFFANLKPGKKDKVGFISL